MRFTGVFLCRFEYIKKIIIYLVVITAISAIFLLALSYIIPNIHFSKLFFTSTNSYLKKQDLDINMEKLISGYNIFCDKNYAMYKDKENNIIEYGFKKESSISENNQNTENNENNQNKGEADKIDYTSELDRGKKETTVADGISEVNTKDVKKTSLKNMTILNYADNRDIDYTKLFERNIALTKKNDNILLYHTHTSETYSQSEGYSFSYTGTFRTTEPQYNMLNIGDNLEKALTAKNFKVIQDTTPHDYGTYENAYTKSKQTLINNLEKYKNFGMVIDVHRDAYADTSKKVSTMINGKEVAQLMFVMGIGANGYENKYWEDNLALALQLQKLANDMYPGLFRAMLIRNSKYNQDLTKNSLLLEVGTTGNSIEEATLAMKYFANVLDKFYKQ